MIIEYFDKLLNNQRGNAGIEQHGVQQAQKGGGAEGPQMEGGESAIEMLSNKGVPRVDATLLELFKHCGK